MVTVDSDLRRLNRAELLEVLVKLSEENEALVAEVASLKQQLADRELAVAEAGSLAEAALRVNGFFQAADDAARQYVENVMARADEARRQAESLLEQAQRQAAGACAVRGEAPRVPDEAEGAGGAGEDAGPPCEGVGDG